MHSETVCAAGNSHACFARVIEISSRIIAGGPARKQMSASTKRKSEKCISRTQDEGMGPLASIEHSLMDPKREGGTQNSQQYVLLEPYMLALQLPFGLS